jgi:hypothetical protein
MAHRLLCAAREWHHVKQAADRLTSEIRADEIDDIDAARAETVVLRAKEASLHARMLSFERALQARESAAGGKLRTMLCQRPHIEVVFSSEEPDTGSAQLVRSRARRLQPARVVKYLPGLPS